MKIVILTTDTLHHRYLINKLEKNGHIISNYFFENKPVKIKYKIEPFQVKNQKKYEEDFFFKDFNNAIFQKKIINVDDINNKKSIIHLKKIKPDLGIVFGTTKISKNIIKLFKKNLINIHRGVISKYRGVDSELWSIYHNDFDNIGVTIHEVENILDSGKIYYKKKLLINKKIRIYNLRYHTTIIATNLIDKFLNNYKSIRNNGIKQSKLGRYYSYMPLVIKKTLEKKLKNYLLKKYG